MFVGDFNPKLESFGCAQKNSSGTVLKNIQNTLKGGGVPSELSLRDNF